MGLFRSRAKKNREKAAAEVPSQRAETVTAQAETVTAQAETVTAQAETVTAQAETVTAQAVAARREVRGEARPNPDRPGWGRSLGQQIKGRDEPAGQE